MIENYNKTTKFLDAINPYKYLEARNKMRLQILNQKKQEKLEKETEINFKGFILANKLKSEYEKQLREEIGEETINKTPNLKEEQKEKQKDGEIKSTKKEKKKKKKKKDVSEKK